ncbi:MAG: hypothetical protein V4736_07905 [Bdellovibrionota bacterium]
MKNISTFILLAGLFGCASEDKTSLILATPEVPKRKTASVDPSDPNLEQIQNLMESLSTNPIEGISNEYGSITPKATCRIHFGKAHNIGNGWPSFYKIEFDKLGSKKVKPLIRIPDNINYMAVPHPSGLKTVQVIETKVENDNVEISTENIDGTIAKLNLLQIDLRAQTIQKVIFSSNGKEVHTCENLKRSN